MRNKKIFFIKINILNLPMTVLLGILGFQVYFLKASSILQNKRVSDFLSYINIIKIDFNNPEHSVSKKYVKMKKKSYLIAKDSADIIIKSIWSQELKKFFIEKTFFRIFLTNYLNSRAFEILLLFEFAGKLQQNRQRLYFWVNKNKILEEILKNYSNIAILKPSYLNVFTDAADVGFQLLFSLKNKFKKNKIKKPNFKRKKTLKSINFNKFKTIFFVSGGIVGGASANYLNFKNFFFSKEKSSPINKQNIITSEISKSLEYQSEKYFYKLKLKFFYWHNKRSLKIFRNFSLFFIKIIFKPSLINDLITSIRICWAIFEIKSNLKILEDFPNLKNAIIENEFQFPTTLAIALKHKNINITCIAKSYLYSSQKHQFLFDNYFILGKQTLLYLNHQFYKKINPIIIGGHESMVLKNTSKYLNKFSKPYKLTCLVLDYHSDKNWYKSSISPLVNWNENIEFYKIVLKISKKNPKILFVLKSKNYDWIKIPFFSDIYKMVKKQKNLILFSNKIKMTNYEMIQNADFTVAKWTSLVDDFLMNNKPAIVYDNPPFIAGIIKYPSKILSYNINDLTIKIDKIQNNLKKYNSQLKSFRKRYYSKFELKKLQIHLTKILK